MQHPGQAQIVHILGAARDLGAAFEARHRAADLSCRHGVGAITRSPIAALTARAEIDAQQMPLVGRRAAIVGQSISTSAAAASPARASAASSGRAPSSTASAPSSRIGCCRRGAQRDARRGRSRRPSTASDTATPSAGQSSAERVVTFDRPRAVRAATARISAITSSSAQHRLVIAGRRDPRPPSALAAAGRRRARGAQRDPHRRQVHMRVGMGEVAADGRHVRTRTLASVRRVRVDDRRMGAHRRRMFQRRERRHGADPQRAVGLELDAAIRPRSGAG